MTVKGERKIGKIKTKDLIEHDHRIDYISDVY